MPEPTSVDREVLPIPDRPYDGPVYEDAKDPAATFPPIEPLRPPAGAPNVLVVLIDDAGFGCSSAFGGPCQTPTAERLAGERAEVQPLPHDGAVLADAGGAALGPQPPHGRDGRDHGDRDVGAGLQLDPAEHVRAAGGDAQAQRLLDRAVRQVPRGARCGRRARSARSTPGRAAAAASSTSTASSAARRTSTTRRSTRGRRRSSPTRRPEEGYHFTEDMTDQAIAWIRQQKALMADKPFFVYFAPGATHAPHHVAAGVVGEVQGRVRPGLGRAARGDVRPPEGARRDPARRRADRAARGDPGLGRDPRRPQAGAGAPDGGLRRLPGAHRPPRRAARRRARRPRRPRRHARLLHHRRQRRERRGRRCTAASTS